MPKVMADAQLWLHYFLDEHVGAQEQAAVDALDRFITEERVVLCGPVEAVLYQRLSEEARAQLEAHLVALSFIETNREDYRHAGTLLASLQEQDQALSLTEAVTAALCLRHDLTLLENDARYERVEGLRRVSWRGGNNER